MLNEYELFWAKFLKVLKDKRSNIMIDRPPTKKHWLQTRGRVHLSASLKKHGSFVVLCIERSDPVENTQLFRKLLLAKSEIEKKFGESLLWEEKPGIKRCTIKSELIPLGIADTDKHVELQDILSDKLIRLNSALEIYYDWLEVK